MSQRYTYPLALERMAAGTCPECGWHADDHFGSPYFWQRPFSACDLQPAGVSDRIAQYERAVAAAVAADPADTGR